jgi:hypothetical protein
VGLNLPSQSANEIPNSWRTVLCSGQAPESGLVPEYVVGLRIGPVGILTVEKCQMDWCLIVQALLRQLLHSAIDSTPQL